MFFTDLFTAFTAGLMLVGLAELGDKTFFIAALLAMNYSRRLVFLGAFAALAVMTLLAVGAGQVVAILPSQWVHLAEVVLFAGFGLKLLYDGWRMDGCCDDDEVTEAKTAIAAADAGQIDPKALSALGITSRTFGLVFLGEWGDRTQITTVMLAATHSPIGVAMGAMSGFFLCIGLAVVAGRLVAGRLSERFITLFAGTLFIAFAIAAVIRGVG
ncbi:TMEM165/GDT1 family protein [Nodosilinea sp. P-1105]|uniref:TMEM165/GDT1 family protein n=1 Tax=Nodosilinea sp. P-1105 TaxID=2546229 RepID=UPI00146ABF3D|nr:TMEM165/GDT1 family protein [Nodosilinea sp. P-1105]NMF81975.1 TMEM165/GDT1 family protein [Nodosilinea sp. P-1105]